MIENLLHPAIWTARFTLILYLFVNVIYPLPPFKRRLPALKGILIATPAAAVLSIVGYIWLAVTEDDRLRERDPIAYQKLLQDREAERLASEEQERLATEERKNAAAARREREAARKKAEQDKANAQHSLEYKLATIDAGSLVQEDDLTIARFRSLLDQLEPRYVESRAKLAAITVNAQKMLRNDGIDERMIRIMEGLVRIAPINLNNQQYAEYAAIYVQLRTQGMNHEQATAGLGQLLGALGAR